MISCHLGTRISLMTFKHYDFILNFSDGTEKMETEIQRKSDSIGRLEICQVNPPRKIVQQNNLLLFKCNIFQLLLCLVRICHTW